MDIFTGTSCNMCHTWNRGNTVDVRGRNGAFCDGQTLIDPGNPDGSCLWQLVETGQMPMIGGPLSGSLKDTLRIWILEGAKDN